MMIVAEIAFHSYMNQQMVADGVKRKRNYDFAMIFVKNMNLRGNKEKDRERTTE